MSYGGQEKGAAVVSFILRPPGRRPVVVDLNWLTAHVAAYRVHRRYRNNSDMGRLSKHFDRVKNAISDFETEVERDANKIVERLETTIKAKKDAVMMRKHELLDAHMGDLAEFEKDIDEELRGNGDGSEDGEKPATTGAEPAKLAANAWTNPNTKVG